MYMIFPDSLLFISTPPPLWILLRSYPFGGAEELANLGVLPAIQMLKCIANFSWLVILINTSVIFFPFCFSIKHSLSHIDMFGQSP